MRADHRGPCLTSRLAHRFLEEIHIAEAAGTGQIEQGVLADRGQVSRHSAATRK